MSAGAARPWLASMGTTDGAAIPSVAYRDMVLPLHHFLDGVPQTLTETVRNWSAWESPIRLLLADPLTKARLQNEGTPLVLDALLPPVTGGQTFCAIGNYRDQLLEAALDAQEATGDAETLSAQLEESWQRRRSSGAPYVALTGSARIGKPQGPIAISSDVTTLDWEVEIAAIIGRPGWQLSADQALDVVAGYCVANDLTKRDAVFRSDVPAFGTDWLASKGQPGWLPLGPRLIPAADVMDPDGLDLELRLNGAVMQSGNSRNMLFSVAELIAHISQHTRLEPGDVVCTGSPAGFGSHYGRYILPGDVLEASVQGLGTQKLTFAAITD